MGKARILAVDDQLYFRELIQGLLEAEGFEVRSCASGDEALEVIEGDSFDVIVTDLMMPGVDGAELLRRVKEQDPDQPVVLVTGVVDVEAAEQAMKLGASDYILKPFDPAALVSSLEKILARRRLGDEHARLMDENLNLMGAVSLVERCATLFASLSVKPLAERLVESLCLETRARAAVLWAAEDLEGGEFELVAARGGVRLEGEPERASLAEIEARECPGLCDARSRLVEIEGGGGEPEPTLFVPLRVEGQALGVARLSDKLGGEPFEASDAQRAEKVCDFGAIALRNALRFESLERRSLRDPETRAYSYEYLAEAIGNEIQRATRFGHRFTLMRIELRGQGAQGLSDRESVEAARRIEGALRTTDVMAEAEEGGFVLLLPQTDPLGAGVLARRIRDAFSALWEGRRAPAARFATASFPADATEAPGLERILADRVAQAGKSVLATQPGFLQAPSLDALFDRMLELGSVQAAGVEGQLLRFVLEDLVRRPGERGVLFLSPGARRLAEVIDCLEQIRSQPTRTEIVLLAEGEPRETHPQVRWVAKSSLDRRRPFLVYYGDGPAYAMIGSASLAADCAAIFQTADRPLVEHLAFELERALEIPLSA